MSGPAPTTSTSKTSSLVIALIYAAAVVLYVMAVLPAQESILKARKQLAELEEKNGSMERDLRESPKVKSVLSKVISERQPFMDALLEPLLQSWSMRARTMLDPLAVESGLKGMEYVELSPRALPLPKPVPVQLYTRLPIRVTCHGSYAEIVSFIMRVEKAMPLVSLQSLEIKAQREPDEQSAAIVFEWPAKGKLSRNPAPAKGGAK